MASFTLSLLSLLLLLTTTAARNTTAFNTTAKAPAGNTTARNTVKNITTGVHPIPPPKRPHPIISQKPPSAHLQAQLDAIIDAIIGAGDFSNWANLLAEADPSTIPMSATLFIPADSATAGNHAHPASNDPLLLPNHIVPRRFSFSELQLFPSGARLATLLPGTFLLINNNSATNFTINGAKLIKPNLYQNAVVSVHGVEGFLITHSAPAARAGQAEFEDIGARATRKPPLPVWRRVQPATRVSAGVTASCSWNQLLLSVFLVLWVIYILGLPTLKMACSIEDCDPCSTSAGNSRLCADCTWKFFD